MPTLLRISLWLALAALSAAASASPLDEILRCNAEALGGEAAFARIDNLRIELDIRESGFEVTANYVASRAGYMRIDITAGGQPVFAEGLDGARAWQWTPEAGVTTSSAAGAAALRNGVESPGRFYTLRQLRDRGARLELVEPGPLARPEEWQLRFIRDDGSVIDHFIDRESCLPTRELSRRALHPDVDSTEVLIETVHSEPFTVDGLLRFRRDEQRSVESGEWLGTTTLRSVEHNLSLPEGFFRPGVQGVTQPARSPLQDVP
jgi:hypothetical protein